MVIVFSIFIILVLWLALSAYSLHYTLLAFIDSIKSTPKVESTRFPDVDSEKIFETAGARRVRVAPRSLWFQRCWRVHKILNGAKFWSKIAKFRTSRFRDFRSKFFDVGPKWAQNCSKCSNPKNVLNLSEFSIRSINYILDWMDKVLHIGQNADFVDSIGHRERW